MSQDSSTRKSLFLIMEQFTKASGKMETDKDLEFKYGQMELNMKDTGKTTRHLEEESFGMLMETYMMENGMKIKLMGMGFTLI